MTLSWIVLDIIRLKSYIYCISWLNFSFESSQDKNYTFVWLTRIFLENGSNKHNHLINCSMDILFQNLSDLEPRNRFPCILMSFVKLSTSYFDLDVNNMELFWATQSIIKSESVPFFEDMSNFTTKSTKTVQVMS